MDEQQLEAARTALYRDRLAFEVERALGAANVNPAALADATALLTTLALPQFGDDGRVAKLSVHGEEYASVADAARAFVDARPHFRAPEPAPEPAKPREAPRPVSDVAEAFARTPAPAPAKATPKADSMTPGELAAAGWAERPKK